MTKSARSIFVLWDSLFDTELAVAITSRLRSEGVRVKIVGLYGRPCGGQHGIVLTPDLTLRQALTQIERCRYLFIPSDPFFLKKLSAEPRIQEIFLAATKSGAALAFGFITPDKLEEIPFFHTLSSVRTIVDRSELDMLLAEILSDL